MRDKTKGVLIGLLAGVALMMAEGSTGQVEATTLLAPGHASSTIVAGDPIVSWNGIVRPMAEGLDIDARSVASDGTVSILATYAVQNDGYARRLVFQPRAATPISVKLLQDVETETPCGATTVERAVNRTVITHPTSPLCPLLFTHGLHSVAVTYLLHTRSAPTTLHDLSIAYLVDRHATWPVDVQIHLPSNWTLSCLPACLSDGSSARLHWIQGEATRLTFSATTTVIARSTLSPLALVVAVLCVLGISVVVAQRRRFTLVMLPAVVLSVLLALVNIAAAVGVEQLPWVPWTWWGIVTAVSLVLTIVTGRALMHTDLGLKLSPER